MEELNLLKENNENLTEMRTNNENEWEEKYRILTDDFELLRSSEALLRQTNLGIHIHSSIHYENIVHKHAIYS